MKVMVFFLYYIFVLVFLPPFDDISFDQKVWVLNHKNMQRFNIHFKSRFIYQATRCSDHFNSYFSFYFIRA